MLSALQLKTRHIIRDKAIGKINLLDVSKFFLFLLIISINLREPYLHSREILLFLTLVTSVEYIDYKKLIYPSALVVIWIVTSTYNLFVNPGDIDINNGGFDTIIISSYLLLMCFKNESYYKTIVKSYLCVSVIVALITIVLWIACYFSNTAFNYTVAFFARLKAETNLDVARVGYRSFLGFRMLTVWYRTSPCMICALGCCLVERLKGIRNNSVAIFLLTVALFISSTRMNMMVAVLLIFSYYVFYWIEKGFRISPFVVLLVTIIIAVVVAWLFIHDSNSTSSKTKSLDTRAYFQLFESDKIRTLFFGWGAGSLFYSPARRLWINNTELSLFETIRRYGCISALIIFFFIWSSPFRTIGFKQKSIDTLFYFEVVLCYIVTACTNPFLMDSLGFCALLFYNCFFEYTLPLSKKKKNKKILNYVK